MGRKCLECQWCGNQFFSMVWTIFEGLSTPLVLWFYAMYLVTATHSGIAANEMERQPGIDHVQDRLEDGILCSLPDGPWSITEALWDGGGG